MTKETMIELLDMLKSNFETGDVEPNRNHPEDYRADLKSLWINKLESIIQTLKGQHE